MELRADWLLSEPFGGYVDASGARSNPLLEKSYAFALKVIKAAKALHDAGWHDLARQLFRSGTSIGALIREAQQPESRADFIHKLKIAAKEGEETHYWLCLCRDSEELPYEEGMIQDEEELQRLLGSSIATARSRV